MLMPFHHQIWLLSEQTEILLVGSGVTVPRFVDVDDLDCDFGWVVDVDGCEDSTQLVLFPLEFILGLLIDEVVSDGLPWEIASEFGVVGFPCEIKRMVEMVELHEAIIIIIVANLISIYRLEGFEEELAQSF